LATEAEALAELERALKDAKGPGDAPVMSRTWANLFAASCPHCSGYHFSLAYRYDGRQKGMLPPDQMVSDDSYPSRAHAVLEGHTRFMRFSRQARHGYRAAEMYDVRTVRVLDGEAREKAELGGVRYWSDEFSATNPQFAAFPTEYVFSGAQQPDTPQPVRLRFM